MPEDLVRLIQRVVRAEARRSQRSTARVSFPTRGIDSGPANLATDPSGRVGLEVGGQVLAADPPSFMITQTPFQGWSRGVEVGSIAPTLLQVPTALLPMNFFVMIDENSVVSLTAKQPDSQTLFTAVIHLPYEDTYEIHNDPSDDPMDHVGWIELPDETTTGDIPVDLNLDAVRDAVREVLAESIIGNIVLSEGLKIVNAAGTIEMDSTSFRIKDGDGNLRALLDEDSQSFFNAQGLLLAEFGSSGAQIGDILITPTQLQSRDYVGGTSGMVLRRDGFFEAQNAIIRGFLAVPTLSTLNYDHPSGNYTFQRRRHHVEDVVITDGDEIEFESLTDHREDLVAPFLNKPVIDVRENLMALWDPDVMSGTRVVQRKMIATPMQSGTSTLWNTFTVQAHFVESGTTSNTFIESGGGNLLWKAVSDPARAASFFDSNFDTSLWPTFPAKSGTDFVNEGSVGDPDRLAYDVFFQPVSGTREGISGSIIDIDIRSRSEIINAGAFPDVTSAVFTLTYYMWIGKSGQPIDLSDGISPQTGTVVQSITPPSRATTVTETVNRFSFLGLDEASDWAVKVDFAKFEVTDWQPAGANHNKLNIVHQSIDRLVYRTSTASTFPIVNSIVDFEITED